MDKFLKIFNSNGEIDSTEELNEQIKQAYFLNKDFFGKDTEVEVYLVYSREEMDRVCKRQTPIWLVGKTTNNRVYIFSPSVIDKVSDHSKNDFICTLRHEIAHVFCNKFYNFLSPIWLSEGLAGIVAEQYRNVKFEKQRFVEFSLIHDNDGWRKYHSYPQAFIFTKYLIGKFGKEKILLLVSNISKDETPTYEDFTAKFREVSGFDFSQVVKEWLDEYFRESL